MKMMMGATMRNDDGLEPSSTAPALQEQAAPVMEITIEAVETPALTKAHLADLLFEQIGLNKRESKDMVEAFFDLIVQRLVDGEDVKISGFGNFQIRTKAARPGRNPRTGEAIPIGPRRVATFHASAKLKEQISGTASAAAPDEVEWNLGEPS